MIDYTDISLTIFHQDTAKALYSPQLIICLALSGNWNIYIRKEPYHLEKGGLLLIEPFSIYRITCIQTGTLICVNIPESYLELVGCPSPGNRIMCYSPAMQARFAQVRSLLADIVLETQKESGRSVLISKHVIYLLEQLVCRFEYTETKTDHPDTAGHMEHILRFLGTHWQQKVTIQQLAQKAYLTPGYISHLFRRELDTTMTDCLRNIRLQHAAQALRDISIPISDIACAHGFSSASSFTACFREIYGYTPSQYRQHRKFFYRPYPKLPVPEITILEEYQKENLKSSISSITKERFLSWDINSPANPLPQTWRQTIYLGHLYDVLDAQIQKLIQQAQKQIGFINIWVNQVFCPDFQVFDQLSATGELHFSYTDLAFDFLLANRLKPWVEFSMRESDGIHLQCAVAHWIEYYGAEEVRNWHFAIDADTPSAYTAVYHMLKALDKDLCVGVICFPKIAHEYAEQIHDFLIFRNTGKPENKKDFKGKLYPDLWLPAIQTPSDTIFDTCQYACALIQRICQMNSWQEPACLSDFSMEKSWDMQAFCGGIGIFSYCGLPKASWQALCLLRQLEKEYIRSGDGYLITRGQNNIQVLLYPEPGQPEPVHVVLECGGLPMGKYKVQHYTLNAEHGSTYDAFLRMGAPERMTSAQIQYIAQQAHPKYQIHSAQSEGRITYDICCQPDELHLVIFRRMI